MKNRILMTTISFLFIGLVIIPIQNLFFVIAQTNNPVSSSSSTVIDESVKALKDKIATKVAELQKQNKKVISGLINKKEGGSLELKSDENLYNVVTDETLTKTYSIINNSQKEIKFEDLIKNDFIIVAGTPVENSVNANYIYKDQQYIVGSGKITEVNKIDYSIKVITAEKDEYILDFELTSKQLILDIKTLNINKAGFSKIKEGDSIHFVFKKPAEEKFTRAPALRTLIIPQEYFTNPATPKP